jgi:hypothetical protein
MLGLIYIIVKQKVLRKKLKLLRMPSSNIDDDEDSIEMPEQTTDDSVISGRSDTFDTEDW